MTKVILKKGNYQRIFSGHPWVYSNEIGTFTAPIAGGEIVEVFDSRNRFVGRGYYNVKSQITVRLLTRDINEQIDEAFFKTRIESCLQYRQKLGYTENFRLVFGESDFLPGLIIDKFGDYFVLQTLSLGMDKWKEVIAKVLMERFSPKGIYERNDVPVRKLEGLPEQKQFLSDPFATKFQLEEQGVKIWIDVEAGQKTGFFLDQKENRQALKHIKWEQKCWTASVIQVHLHFLRQNSEQAVFWGSMSLKRLLHRLLKMHLLTTLVSAVLSRQPMPLISFHYGQRRKNHLMLSYSTLLLSLKTGQVLRQQQEVTRK